MKIRILMLTTLLLTGSSFKSTHSMQQRKLAVQQENKICPRCGLSNPPEQELCLICSMPLLASPAQAQQHPAARIAPAAAQVGLGARDDEEEKKEYAQAPVQGKQFLAKGFFKEIVGMTEEEFRDTYAWQWNKQTHKDARLGALAGIDTLAKWKAWKQNWIKEYEPAPGVFPRQAIFAGTPEYQTLGQINQHIAQTPINPHRNKAQFNILLHDNQNPQATEITHLQANPQNKHAVFQLASTFFGPLEGGMIDPKNSITEMLKYPVQGEWASVSAAGATIFRKYFMITDSFINRRAGLNSVPGEVYLLHNLRNKAPVIPNPDRHGHTDRIVDIAALKKYIYDPKDKQQIGIFSHENIYTTSECIANQHEKGNATLLSIPLRNDQLITQIFNASYDLKSYIRDVIKNKEPLSPQVIDFAKMVLEAMYEGTLKQASLNGSRKVFLTLIGGGAFLNDIRWIAKALEQPGLIEFMQKSGLEINIIFRADANDTREFKIRNAAHDKEFVTRMYHIADRVNGTQVADHIIASQKTKNYFNYIDQAYSKIINNVPADVFNGSDAAPEMVSAAPAVKPRSRSRSPQRRAPFPVQQQQQQAAAAQLHVQQQFFPQPPFQGRMPQQQQLFPQQSAVQPQARPSLSPQPASQQPAPLPQSAAAQPHRVPRIPRPFTLQHALDVQPHAQQQPGLMYQEILGTGKDYKLGWLWNEKIGDWALINYGKSNKPEVYADGSKNFFFVSPNIPSEPVPENRDGQQLFYWKSSNQLPLPKQFSNKVNWVIVESLPGSGRPYIYSTAKKLYVPAIRSPRTNVYIPAE